MCIPLSAIFPGWEEAPTRHHHQFNHSEEDDCITDCLCCPCNILCYVLLAVEEFLCCWEWLNCCGGGEFKYRPGRGGPSPGSSLHGGSLPGRPGSPRPTLHTSMSAPAGLKDFGRPIPGPSKLKGSASMRPARHGAGHHHCWECEVRRHHG